MNATALTVGGLLAALLVLVANLHPWYKGTREMRQLAAFGKGALGAACAAACPGGALGWIHQRSGSVANGSGESVGAAAAGTDTRTHIATGQLVGLGTTGAVVVVLSVFLVYLSYKSAGKTDRRRIVGGAFVGSVFLLTAGVAGALAWLPGLLNGIGDAIVAAAQGKGVL